MKKAHVTFITLPVLAIARTMDLVTTLHFNPSLTLEANPVVLIFSGGVGSLLLVTSLFTLLAVGGLILFWRGRRLSWSKTPATFTSFVWLWLHRVAFDRKPFAAYLPGRLYSTEGLQATRLFGVGLSWALIFGSLAAIYAWLAIWKQASPQYSMLFSLLSLGRFSFLPAVIAFSGFLVGALLFFVSDYAELKRPQLILR